jgi:hypothetical protein
MLMRTFTVSTEPVSTKLETRAAEALRSLLGRVSAIKLIELKRESDLKHESDLKCESQLRRESELKRESYLKCESELNREAQPSGRSATFLAQPGGTSTLWAKIDIFGHAHTLACALIPGGEPSQLRVLLRGLPRELDAGVAPLTADAVPFVIAPYLSPEAQALLKQSSIGFLDLEGNARLNVGEIFIGMRSLSCASGLDHIDQTDQSALLYAFPARPAPIPIVPSELPNFSPKHVGRVGAVAVPA